MKKILLFCSLISSVAAVFVYARIFQETDNFAQALDFPREALIYIQTRDLPKLLKIWEDSDLKKKYLESENYSEFQNNHLAMKLTERWNETGNSLGFFADLAAISDFSENKAALAVYDIGKLEFVFIAPMSDEKILATMLFQNASDFDEILLDDGTKVYSKEMEVDRGRQTQKVFFTNIRGRFILATSEKYFLQTLENINGKSTNNRISDDLYFQQLAAKTIPNLATIWINQEKLNNDYYFRHYWLMSDLEELKNLRAGMFDLEIREDKVVEKRIFLTNKEIVAKKINFQNANHLLKFVPADVPFYRVKTANLNELGRLITETVFDSDKSTQIKAVNSGSGNYRYYEWRKSWGYDSLDSDFEESIDEKVEENVDSKDFRVENAVKLENDLVEIIKTSKPTILVELARPQILPAPLFFDNQKTVIISLEKPSMINRQNLENKLMEIAKNKLAIAYTDSGFGWKDITIKDLPVRECEMPSLGWKIFYVVTENELIFSNSDKILESVLTINEKNEKLENNFNEFTAIRLTERENSYNLIIRQMSNEENKYAETAEKDFFVDNIGSLLEVIGDVQEIRIKKSVERNFVFEEISFLFAK